MCNRVLGARQKSKSLTFSAGVPQVRDEVESKDLPGPKGGVALPLPGGRVSSAAAHHDDVDHAELRMRAAPDATDGDTEDQEGRVAVANAPDATVELTQTLPTEAAPTART